MITATKELTVYKFKNFAIRITTDEKNEPWFVAKDVCEALGIKRTDAALRAIPDDEKGTQPMSTPGGIQNLSVISESGRYRLTMRCDKPEAKPFQDWVVKEVLPAIRKTGVYMAPALVSQGDHWDLIHAMATGMTELKSDMDAVKAEIAELKGTKQQAAVLAPVKEVSLGGKINQVVRDYAYKYELPYRDCWHKLYYEFKYRYGTDLSLRASNRGVTGVQIAEEMGVSGELLGLAVFLFTK